jgi:hypothetical protein
VGNTITTITQTIKPAIAQTTARFPWVFGMRSTMNFKSCSKPNL